METAVKNGLVPIINVATQNSVGFYSPRWLMEEYRGVGEGFVDSVGMRQMQGEYVTKVEGNLSVAKLEDLI